MSTPYHPILNPAPRHHADGPFTSEEVALTGRNHAMQLEGLRYDVTPAGMHYLLTHFDIPYVERAEDWRLAVSGKVSRPLSLSLADIKSMPQRTLRVTLECAGNGRKGVSPRWQSMPWAHEAVGTAEWTGTPLAGVLDAAGLDPDAVEIAFLGSDRGFDKGIEHNYGRSLTPAMARDDNVLLVHAMNGAPLLPQHGFPLRLVVPGWYGMASVKWLDRIEALDRPFDGYQQVGTYHYRSKPGEKGVPITTIRVKSLLVPPGVPSWYERQRLVERGTVRLLGRAWTGGGGTVSKVEVGVDGAWRPATLAAKSVDRFAWQAWHYDWQAEPGEHEIACRATDETGAVQPDAPAWDAGGFGNNSVQRVRVTVR